MVDKANEMRMDSLHDTEFPVTWRREPRRLVAFPLTRTWLLAGADSRFDTVFWPSSR
jgi:hypothetical protein